MCSFAPETSERESAAATHAWNASPARLHAVKSQVPVLSLQILLGIFQTYDLAEKFSVMHVVLHKIMAY
jgi:hypothetical protein